MVRAIGQFAQVHAEWLLPAEKLYDVAIGSYAPYHALCGVTTKTAGLKGGTGKYGEYMLELGILFLLGNVSYGMVDLETSPITRTHLTIPEETPITVPARSGLILGLGLPLPEGAGELISVYRSLNQTGGER